MVLLVVDTQKLITNEKLYKYEEFKSNIKKLIAIAREKGIEPIFVRHDDGVGNELTKGNPGYEIFEEFQPTNKEVIFDKTVNSSFKATGLLEYLRQKEETEIIIVGLQTDYCIDATIKAGFEHGIGILHILPPIFISLYMDAMISSTGFELMLMSRSSFFSEIDDITSDTEQMLVSISMTIRPFSFSTSFAPLRLNCSISSRQKTVRVLMRSYLRLISSRLPS